MAVSTNNTTAVARSVSAGPLAARPMAGGVLPEAAQWPAAQRLLVLVPASLQDEMRLAARLYAAALARHNDVLYLGLAAKTEDEPGLRRRLALLAACTRDNHTIRADYRLAVGDDWLAWLRLAWTPSDLVLCHSEQRLRRGWWTRSLGEALAERLGQPVVLLDGFCGAETRPLAGAARRALFWAGALALLVGCFWLQAAITRQAQGMAQTMLVGASVAGEFALLAAWNKWMT